MRLHNMIADKPGARKTRKRLGRGHGSGHGKTAGKGHKGQKARSGGTIRIGFEGGQMPLHRRLPQRGFSNYKYRVDYAVVNVCDLESPKLDGVEVIDRAALVKAGFVRSSDKLVKILGFGFLNKKVSVKADKFSESAVEKIKAAGGEAILNAPAQETAAEEAPAAE